MTNPVREAVRALREEADLAALWSEEDRRSEMEPGRFVDPVVTLRTAAENLATYFAEPQAEEVERLVAVYMEANWSVQDSLRAVLKAIGAGP